ncbi:hypothetical protein [Amycolatopsis sp. H20-H5]|uniref:hypothetical protein n=1 Tax=Amycolatopsis sp. H20-H5 TaxID=3046309 RepID=UPI002DB964CC|nr:hypothetical protein [Amycolatopsis sp. H20-H5]MEC3978359.1 hypothetical protein [Amycolatopsis sp. H20-H5]
MTTPSAPDSEHVLVRARRTYLIAMLLGPIVLAVLGVLSLVGLRRPGSGAVLPALGFFAMALIVLLAGYVLRNAPSRWNRVAAISGVLAGVYGAIGVLVRLGDDQLLIAGAVLVVLALVPWLAVRNASASVLARPTGELVATMAELSFPLRDEADGWFLIRHDEIAVRIRRERRRHVDDNHDDSVVFAGIAAFEVVDLPGGEKVEIGLGYTVTPGAGPALRVRVADEGVRQDEWIVPIDEAGPAAEALRARMTQAPSR